LNSETNITIKRATKNNIMGKIKIFMIDAATIKDN